MAKATTVEKSPKIHKVSWVDKDEWDGGSPRLFEAWVARPAVQPFVASLQFVGATDVQVQD